MFVFHSRRFYQKSFFHSNFQSNGIIQTIVEKSYFPDENQRSLAFEAERDEENLDNEQTWPTAQELQKAEKQQNQIKKRVPKGTSQYQAAWIVSDEEEEEISENQLDNVL